MTRDRWIAACAEALVAARRAAGMSQAELAERLEVHRQTVYRWEAGSQLPDVWHWARLQAVLPGLALPAAG